MNHKLNLSCGFLVFQLLLGRKKDRKKDTPSKNHWEKKTRLGTLVKPFYLVKLNEFIHIM